MKLACLMTLVAGLAAAKPIVFFIRHGEKPSGDENGLSAQGKQRAQCLRNVFAAGTSYNIGKIMAQAYKPSGKRKRPYDTVKPLADDLGLTVDVSCDRDDAKCVRKAVRKYDGPGNILICWEHKMLTELAEKLGDENAPSYPSDRFDEIWIDPHPYSRISDIVSEDCPGLDD
ncbi:uncharacterized protein UV8b_07665 [Ustilaginoidea virens]|uniref:Phosphoglycerate mutase family protein n=1 Tax=Ustilaginoidea virens TaxID=1159556 RepID=A0A8E5HXI7_USTVR|nr:uncharacterized protein UV8b_07665 [Ustilaginoidea virens]QUC23424.1 hypothetical protein UV8b_07665 [Ustilaginoidea virens]